MTKIRIILAEEMHTLSLVDVNRCCQMSCLKAVASMVQATEKPLGSADFRWALSGLIQAVLAPWQRGHD